MSKITTAFDLLKNKKKFNKALARNIQYAKVFHIIPDKIYLEIIYRLCFGRKLDLKNPKSYNEKMQWIKLYDRRKDYSKYVDKLAVRNYITSIIGQEYLIPLLGHWDNFDLINFDLLPNQFVLKCNHDSGSVVICKDKEFFDKEKAKSKISKALKRNMFYFGREWPYKSIKPCIIAEEYMTDNDESESLTDYKIYCFDGMPKIIMMASNRFTDKRFDYLDIDFNWLDFEWGAPRSDNKPAKPQCYDEMVSLAKSISKGLSQVRVDFYVSKGRVYFGEMTLFDGSGFEEIIPYEWDLTIGNWINLRRNLSNDE